MHDAVPTPTLPELAQPPAVSLAELWPWSLFGVVLAATLLYVVGIEGSAISFGPGELIHEFMHDGRHVLAFPCH